MKLIQYVAVSFLGLVFARVSFAADITWTGGANDGNKWSTPDNWNGGVPTAADVAVFDVAATTTIDVDCEDATAKQIKISATSKAVTFGGQGLLTLTVSSATGANVQAQANMPVLNLNSTTCFTTFDCRYHTSTTGKVAYGPGCVYNNDVSSASTYIMFGGITGVTPGSDYAKSVFKAGFSRTGTSSTQIMVGLSSTHELVIDNGASGKTFNGYNYFYFTIGNSVAATTGKMTVKSGKVNISGTMKNASTGGASLSVEGGTFATTYGDASLVGKVSVGPAGEFVWTAAGTSNPFNIWDDQTILVGSNYRFRSRGNGTIFLSADDPDIYYIDGVYDALWQNSAELIVNNQGKTATLLDGRGKGELWAYTLKTDDGVNTLKDLTVRIGKQFASVHDGGTFTLDGVTVKMFADLPDYAGKLQKFNFVGKSTIDTADCNGLAKNYMAEFKTSYFPDPQADVVVRGGGVVILDQFYSNAQPSGTIDIGSITVEEGTTLDLCHSTSVSVEKLVLGANARLVVSNGVLRADQAKVGPNAIIDVAFSKTGLGAANLGRLTQEGQLTVNVIGQIRADTPDATYAALRCSGVNAAMTTLNFDSLTAMFYGAIVTEDGAFLAPSSVTPTADYEWTGAVNGNWSDAGNWTALPPRGAQLVVSGSGNRVMNNDLPSGSLFGSITFRETAAPHVVTGNALIFTNGVTSTSVTPTVKTIVSSSRSVEIFDCDVSFDSPTAVLEANNGGTLRFNGKVRTKDGQYTDHLHISGNVQFGGDAVVHKLYLQNGAVLQVLSGGRVTVTNQTSYSAQTLRSGRIVVEEGGVFDWAETCGRAFFFSQGSTTHQIDGTLLVGTYGALSGLSQAFVGSGRMDVGRYAYLAGQTLTVSGGLTLNSASAFKTVDANGATDYASVVMNNATLGAKGDWTYGPADGVTDLDSVASSANDRSLKMSGVCAINTQNPDTHVAQTITFSDPIDATGASVVKKGEGKVVLDCEGTSFAGGLTLESGSVCLSVLGTQPVEAGEVAFTGGGLSVTRSLRSSLADWTTLVRATSVSGDPCDPEGKLVFRLVEDGAHVLIQAKYQASGLLVIFK